MGVATLGEEVLIGDFDRDGDVDVDDFEILSMNLAAHLDGPVTYSMGDINLNGTVDLDDFAEFKNEYPAAVGAATGVPEPSGLGLAVMAGGMLLPLMRCRAHGR